jgi:hypothetical protein
VDAPTRRLVDAAGRPFFIHGDAAWSLMVRLNRAEVAEYLDDRRARGFNAVLVNLIEHKFGGPSNRAGEAPFLVAGDFATPNEAYFANADFVIDEAGKRGIVVLLAPLYLGYEGGAEGWYQEALRNGPERCRQFARYIGQRFSRFANIVWVHGGDTPPMAAAPHVEAVVAGLREVDKTHPHTAHSRRGRSALDDYDRPWLDLNTTYGDCATAQSLARRDQERQTRPLTFFFVEGTYENEGADAACLLGQAYWSALSGARGHVFGNRPLWLFDSGWPAALGSTGSQYMRHFAALLATREGFGLVPDDEQRIVVAGFGARDGADYAAAARSPSGGSVIVYVPTADRRITIDTGMVPGPELVAWWFNPRTGGAQRVGSFATGGPRDFTTPAGAPWVLVLDDARLQLPAPGLPGAP